MRSKRNKFGLRSGNTFHFGGKLSTTRTLRRTDDQHVVVKTVVEDSLPNVDLRQLGHGKGAITNKIKHAIKLKTSPARLAQLLQPSLAFCFSLQPMTAYRPGLDGTPSLAAS